KDACSEDTIRGASAKLAKRAEALNIKTLACLFDEGKVPMNMLVMARALAEGMLSGTYAFNRYKKDKQKKTKLSQVSILVESSNDVKELSRMLEKTTLVMKTVSFVRDIVSTPSNDMTPTHIAAEAVALVKKGKVKVAILEEKQIQKIGMMGIYSVAKGSYNKPKFIVMEYYGDVRSKSPIVLVGKGLAFDSGGISLKPAENMGEMKSDMAGAATVIGVMNAISELKIKQNVVGLVPVLENMPDGKSYKPGDIIKSLAGHTIEITNTDAEGRLALADALAYATRFKPAVIVDIATLTGACSIALGRDLIGMMGNNEIAKEKIKDCSKITGEHLWELPLWDSYNELIKSDVADFKNSAGREAGTITAGLFLSKFVGDYPWIHLDIASTAWINKAKPYTPVGATGVGVRLLVKFVENFSS
ncbi:MAG: leucyl aminopeptidase, partial [Deltaproteobacteria bacterium]